MKNSAFEKVDTLGNIVDLVQNENRFAVCLKGENTGVTVRIMYVGGYGWTIRTVDTNEQLDRQLETKYGLISREFENNIVNERSPYWECPDCGFQMILNQAHVDSGGAKGCGCPMCEINHLKEETQNANKEKLLNELYVLVLSEQHRNLNEIEFKRYVEIANYCKENDIEIPFGIEI